MSNGLCDVKECQSLPYLGWRPLTERRGRKICEQHWRRHHDENDSFDLFEVFKFRRPLEICKSAKKTNVHCCSCGRERLAGHKFCTVCAEERERQRKKRAYHERKKPKPEPIVQENILQCRTCGGTRKPGYTYCAECAKHRRIMTRREAQSRYWRKRHKVAV